MREVRIKRRSVNNPAVKPLLITLLNGWGLIMNLFLSISHTDYLFYTDSEWIEFDASTDFLQSSSQFWDAIFVREKRFSDIDHVFCIRRLRIGRARSQEKTSYIGFSWSYDTLRIDGSLCFPNFSIIYVFYHYRLEYELFWVTTILRLL